MKTMCKRILTMVLALLLAAAFPVSVAADVWIPPDDNVNETLLMSPYFQNDCKALNAFVSNYVEANLREFNSSRFMKTAERSTIWSLRWCFQKIRPCTTPWR